MTRLRLAPYPHEVARRPAAGRHLLAQRDAETIVVYQAYRPAIARFAAEHGCFGGEGFTFSRMSWIKPSFLWMMFRCGWASKEGQVRVLAIGMKRAYFDGLLARVVPSSWDREIHGTQAEWQAAVKRRARRARARAPHGARSAPDPRRGRLPLGEPLRARLGLASRS